MANVSLKFEREIKAPVAEVYRAFTNSMAFREWLCDTATVDPHPDGHIYLSWHTGFYCVGKYITLKSNEEVVFTSLGKDEPSETQVKISICPRKNGSALIVEHTGFKPGWKWRNHIPRISRCWMRSLENLIYNLENGPDLRIIMRPMLGIFFGDFNPDIAKRLNIPVSLGLRLEGVLPGMGAQICGLQKDDVITEMAGVEIKNFNTIAPALSNHKPDEKIKVTFYRGPEKQSVDMVLSRRPLPKIPASPAAFSTVYQKVANADYAALAKALKGIPNSVASRKPAKNEWGVNEILAHLFEGERSRHQYIHELLFSEELVSDGFFDNSNERILAEVAAYPTTKDLMEEYRRSQLVTVNFLKNLPKSFQQHKGTWWHLAVAMLPQPNTHTQEHIEQIKKTVSQVKKKK